MAISSDYVRWFETLRNSDVPLVGGKNASLGELYNRLAAEGVRVPNGFALTVASYRASVTEAKAWDRLHELLDGLDVTDVEMLSRNAAEARRIVYAATGTAELRAQIATAYRRLEEQYGAGVAVAVRSSATAEDLPTASFAGQHESYLNIRGEAQLFEACRNCFASIFTDRAIVYRVDTGFDHFKIGLSVGVMKMVRSDEASSGVIFTLDTESGFRDVVFVTASYGLGENIVQGKVDPDEFYVHKPTFRAGFRSVLRRSMGAKQLHMVYGTLNTGSTTKNLPTPKQLQERFCIGDDDVLRLTDSAVRIEDHYSKIAGHQVPMDIEWAKDGEDGQLYIVQARPETVASQASTDLFESYGLKGSGRVLVTGKAVGEKIATGSVRVIARPEDLKNFKPGEVLVAEATSPDWEPVMKTAGAIVTDRGGRTCHAAIVARELGVPAVVGTHVATNTLTTGMEVTTSCAEGEVRVSQIDHDIGLGQLELARRYALHLERDLALIDLPCLAFRARGCDLHAGRKRIGCNMRTDDRHGGHNLVRGRRGRASL